MVHQISHSLLCPMVFLFSFPFVWKIRNFLVLKISAKIPFYRSQPCRLRREFSCSISAPGGLIPNSAFWASLLLQFHHGMVWVGKEIKNSPSSNPLQGQGHFHQSRLLHLGDFKPFLLSNIQNIPRARFPPLIQIKAFIGASRFQSSTEKGKNAVPNSAELSLGAAVPKIHLAADGCCS